MDRGKRPNKFLGAKNNKIYMDLKDIIREHALPFLPAKSLFKFQGVCRDWKLQIASPFFAHNQSLSCSAISGLFVQNRGQPPSFVSLDPETCGVPDPSLKFLPVPVDVKSSSNGLLCCQGRTEDRAYYICNPVTQQWKIVPKSEMDHGDDPALVLIFNPSLLNFEAEFKLVCAFRSIDFDDAIEFDIYSSKEGTWQTSGEINFAFKVMPGMGFHAKGVIYWTGARGYLLVFDLAKERSKTVMAYNNNTGWGMDGGLGMVGGKLCRASVSGNAVTVTDVSDTDPITMQIIKKPKSWTHRATLDSSLVGNSMEGGSVLYLGGDTVVVQIGKNIYSCNLNTNVTKRMECSCSWSEGRRFPYVNSLAAL